MGNYTGSRIDPDRTCNCIVHWRLAIYDRIRTGYNEFIDIRDDHDAKLSVRTIFYHGVRSMRTDNGMENKRKKSFGFHVLLRVF